MQCGDWNHLNVDTFGGAEGTDWEDIKPIGLAEDRQGYREDLCNNAGFMDHAGGGSQMQIIRKTFLKELITASDGGEGRGAVDTVFMKSLRQDQGSFRWQPGIVGQIKQDGGLESVP